MLPGNAGVCLSALFIDFDNIYLSLKGRDEEAASRFARNPSYWLTQVISGALVRTDAPSPPVRRRIAVGRCYGNPVPRRSGRDGQGDPSSFGFVRHSFMRAGLEVVDCPHLTSQFKNSSDIRIACDVRDYLDHPTRFDEFIILSGDADFTPVLLSLRSHNRQTIIYANDYTSPYYKAFSDGRIREEDLIRCLMQPEGQISSDHMNPFALEQQQAAPKARIAAAPPLRQLAPAPAPVPAEGLVKRKPAGGASEAAIQSLIEDFKVIGDEILGLVVDVVENSEKPVPLAYLADRAQKTLGHPKTIGTNWAGSGGFLNFLTQNLPETMRLSEKPPHFVYNPDRHRLREDVRPVTDEAPVSIPASAPVRSQPATALRAREPQSNNGRLAELQRSITRIYEACQAPPLPPSEYQLLFTLIAAEVRENGFAPDRSADAVVTRAAAAGLKLAPKDVSFVIEAVDEIDPWLEHTRSPSAVARAYRDYVLARCSQVGVQLTDDEYQLIQVWFGASQWTAAGGGGGSSSSGGEPGAGAQDLPRRYGQPDLGLPSPSSHGGVPLPNDFGFPETDERDNEPPAQQSGSLRYSFLKHG
jgi:NYN domain